MDDSIGGSYALQASECNELIESCESKLLDLPTTCPPQSTTLGRRSEIQSLFLNLRLDVVNGVGRPTQGQSKWQRRTNVSTQARRHAGTQHTCLRERPPPLSLGDPRPAGTRTCPTPRTSREDERETDTNIPTYEQTNRQTDRQTDR